jgi:hypothetical protein
MLYCFTLLVFLIDLDRATIFNWVGIDVKTETILNTQQSILLEDPIYKSIESLKLILMRLWKGAQSGLQLSDIEYIIFFFIFIRFVILIFRYNIKTSTYITCIGMFAGFLWYRHFVDILSSYSQLLVKIPYLQKLGVSTIHLHNDDSLLNNDPTVDQNIKWYNPGKFLYYAFAKGMTKANLETGIKYYIDPLSMLISKFNQGEQDKLLQYYYTMYGTVIPRFFQLLGEFSQQLSGIAAYAVITRLGKRYCPYLIRWHWTFLLIIGFVEQILIFFLYRVAYFQQMVIAPNLVYNVVTQVTGRRIVNISSTNPNSLFQFNFLNALLISLILLHLGSIFLALLHALWGQYFYFPFLVENTELHIGPRPKNSIYSGGKTAWQDKGNISGKLNFTKLWYGWFGSGTNENWMFSPIIESIIINLRRFLRVFNIPV